MTEPLIVLVFTLCSTALAGGYLTHGELDDVMKQAVASRDDYIRRFRDLTAVETWATEIVRPSGTVDQRRSVISDFFVYQSRFDSAILREYRITRQVDGKAAPAPLAQATRLFRALGKARTLKEEDAALFDQNVRHVLRFIVTGLTVAPIWPVDEKRRTGFQFALAGRDRVDDEDVVALKYESKAFETREPTTIFVRFKNPRTRMQGTIWLTVKDGRLRRWVDDMLIVDDEIVTPAVLMHKDISYVSSPLGEVPSRIAISRFDKVRDKKAAPTLRLSIRQTYAYEAFRRFDVSTASEIKKPEGQ
jgi:hypothetical protein